MLGAIGIGIGIRLGVAASQGGGAPQPPPGMVWVKNDSGGYVLNASGGRIYTEAR